MYAIFSTGGKQYRASVGDLIDVEKLEGGVGDEVTLTDTRFVLDESGEPRVGAPQVEGAAVVCKIVKQDRNPKVIVFTSKRRKRYQRKIGHRQHYTRLRVEAIRVGE